MLQVPQHPPIALPPLLANLHPSNSHHTQGRVLSRSPHAEQGG